MKDVFDQLMDAERRFYGGGDAFSSDEKCSFCKRRFPADELTNVGEQLIDGDYHGNAVSCVTCDPTDHD
tara:strand:- start:667 stop:873 length:207 start_codon:yes stop_codon:yes gene_type:complete